jgi:hypothetical protein
LKDQYFGDARDYFKYELLEELLGRVPGVEHLVCLWMLTEPDASRQGSVAFIHNARLAALSSFLEECLDAGNRSVWQMRRYFANRGIRYTPWGDTPPYFGSGSRAQYFESLPDRLLTRALLYLDPDIGLREDTRSMSHLAFAELESISQRADDASVVVVYQHFQRKKQFCESMADTIRERVNAPVGYVADPAVGFFAIAGSGKQIDQINSALKVVAASNPTRKFRAMS